MQSQLHAIACHSPRNIHQHNLAREMATGNMEEVDFQTLIGDLSLEEKISLLSGRDFVSTPGVLRVGIPPLKVCCVLQIDLPVYEIG